MADQPTARRRRPGLAVLIPLALLASSAVVYQASNAAFTASTSNPTNNWSAGTVAISDDDSDAAMFNASGLAPGDTDTQCIVVTYSGSLDAAVKLYATSYSNSGLGQYLTFTVDALAGDQSASCGSFVASESTYSGTLDGFGTTKTSYGTGASSWAPTGGSNATMTYRFTWTLQDDNGANGGGSATSVSTLFTWEAQNV